MKKFKRISRKTKPQVDSARVAIERMQRFNPLRNLGPESLRSAHEEFAAGRLRPAAKLWDAIERTDDIVKVVSEKRKKAVSRHGYEVVQVDDSPEAKRHAEALQFFYDNLIATRADDRNIRGGLPMAVRHMMDAVGKKYSVHEIVMKPIEGGLTAELIFVPLWYFENTTGELRLLDGLTSTVGEPLEPGEWLVASGDGVMEACAAAYMFKHLPLQDWLLYSEKFGLPTPVGKSPDSPGSDGWIAMEDAVAAIGNCDGAVISSTGSIEFPAVGSAANLPYPALIERMDRALSSLWRGADLGTMSADNQGASLQGDETDLLEDDDATNITDVLNEQLDRFVVLYACGSTTPKAWINIKAGVREDVEADLKVDETLEKLGYSSALDELQRRYNRASLTQKTNAVPEEKELPNEKVTSDPVAELKKNSRMQIAQAIERDHRPVAAGLADLLDATPDDELSAALREWADDELPQLAAQSFGDPFTASAYADALTAGLFNGYLESDA
jgi:hypothetical protein